MSLATSAVNYIDEIKNGNTTVEEFVSKTLERIKKIDGKLHAFLSINDDAIIQAKEIDRKIMAKKMLVYAWECQFPLKITFV